MKEPCIFPKRDLITRGCTSMQDTQPGRQGVAADVLVTVGNCWKGGGSGRVEGGDTGAGVGGGVDGGGMAGGEGARRGGILEGDTRAEGAVCAGLQGQSHADKGLGVGGGMKAAMVRELEDGLQAHLEQQEKLVRLWLDQHEVTPQPLSATAASTVHAKPCTLPSTPFTALRPTPYTLSCGCGSRRM